MATNYSLQIRVPVTTTYNRWHHYENHCDSEVVYGNLTWDNLLLNIKAYYESTYGGQFLYTYTSSVSHYVLNIDYNNLSTDPVGTYCGDIVAIGIKHGNDWHFGAWVEGLGLIECDTCLNVKYNYCEQINIEVSIPDDTYTLYVLDHQTNTNYYQDIVFTSGVGVWNTINSSYVFNQFSVYTITIQDSAGDFISWIENNKQYNCIRIEFETLIDTNSGF